MATVAERARAIADKVINDDVVYEPFMPSTRFTAFVHLIEQALLAERRLARTETLEEAAKMMQGLAGMMNDESDEQEVWNTAHELRAAAEKEVL